MREGMNCPICGRPTPPNMVEKHHSVPRCRGGKETVQLCRDCGDMLHKIFTNKELERQFNTVAAIKADPRIKNWIKWVWGKPFGICMKTKKRRSGHG